MAINQNHPFEELDGIRCAIVEKAVSPERLSFLRPLLEYNGYEVKVVASPPPKAAAAPAEGDTPAQSVPETFTVGVTDVAFNVTNAIFGRLLTTPEGRVVTMDYWKQRTPVSDDSTPYFQGK
ncbi:MAG: hypothetical protein ACO1G7_08980 [Bacteroidota bacterium]